MRKALITMLLMLVECLPMSSVNAAWYIDHVVIVVNNLATATQDFTQLGFTVIPGGKPGGGFDHNALIPFNDGAYLELFAPLKPRMMQQLKSLKKQHRLSDATNNLNAIKARFVRHVAAGQGLADFAISANRLKLNLMISLLYQRGLKITGPIDMHRTLPNGNKIEWQVAVPPTNSLPFLITDVTPRYLRLGGKGPFNYKNGVTGIASVTVAVVNLQKAAKQYQALLGLKPVTIRIASAKALAFKLRQQTIILAQPLTSQGQLYRCLSVRGEGICRVSLRAVRRLGPAILNSVLTRGANITIE